MTKNVRSFFWKSKKPVEYGSGNCGKPLPKRIEPCRLCPSKCLEETGKKRRGFFGFRKKPEFKKPTNCVEEKPVEEKLTLWETLFGPDPKRSWPDPCTCRLLHRHKRMCRSQDPRLCDPKYKETAGDVFLYTEIVKHKGRPYVEPQPKPPPSFKVPTDVLFRKLSMEDMRSVFARDSIKTDENAKTVSSKVKPHRIPYEELRPPETRRRTFDCHRGIRTEDILRPIKKELNPLKTTQLVNQLNLYEDVEQLKPKENTRPTQSDQSIPQRSRIEQLKFLVRKKGTLNCMSENS